MEDYFRLFIPFILGYNAYVEIIRNPSTFENINTAVLNDLGLEYPINSYHSGFYKIIGFKHSISNSAAISTFTVQKIVVKPTTTDTPATVGGTI